MVSKSAYVKKHRQKLKDKGYVKREVWLPLQFAPLLKLFELSVRKGMVPNFVTNGKGILVMSTVALYESLRDYGFDTDELTADLLGDVVQVLVTDVEEFPIYVSAGEAQILAIMPLMDVADVHPAVQAQLNETMLGMNTMVPLSDFAIVNGQYVLFGALSVNSSFDDVVEEIVMLASNVEGALELIDDIAG